MSKIVKLAIFLGIICLISSAALYYTNTVTAPIISENKRIATEKLLKEIDPNASKFESKEVNKGSIVNEYDAEENGKVTLKIYEVSTYGFQSQITILIAIDTTNNQFKGFKVIEQAETSGYGTQITEDNDYTKQFNTKKISDQIDVISGSSVTTSALNKAIEEAVTYYNENK
ncbi:MAG: FMN-binding protein [Bacilli bacterium]|jgi:electron transport complex protein RnfG|nr:FMN-binding protein [Bacilli bacterium]